MRTAIARFFAEGHRIFFLFAALYAVFTGIVWGLWLGVHAAGGMWSDPPYGMAPHMWHGHEMIFGYAIAAMAGFFLTAVPNWTGAPSPRTRFLTVAALLWVAGRGAMWMSGALPAWAVAIADLAFIPFLAAKIAGQLMQRPKPQNVMFLGFLALLWVSNLFVHLEWMGLTDSTAATGLRAGLLTLGALISTLGGRITPAFTRNAMQRAGVAESRWPASANLAERAALILSLGLAATVLLALPESIPAAIALALGTVHLARLSRWRAGWALRQPILIALHMGLFMLALGLLLWGAAGFGLGSEVAALHVLGIGAVGGMTIAVMSRATLGHSGRPLVAPGPVVLGYALIAAAALLRWLGSTLPGAVYFPAMLGSVALWSLAFALFAASLWSALTGPREQG